MVALQELINKQSEEIFAKEFWPQDYPHILLDENERPVVVDVDGALFSAWLEADDTGAFNQVVLRDVTQTDRVYDERPAADQPNQNYQRYYYDADTREVLFFAREEDVPEGTASALLPTKDGIANDGKVSDEDLSQQLDERSLSAYVEIGHNALYFHKTNDSEARAEFEGALAGQQRFAAGMIEQIESYRGFDDAYPEGSVTAEDRKALLEQYVIREPHFSYPNRESAIEDDLSFKDSGEVDFGAAVDTADIAEAYAEIYSNDGDPSTAQPGVNPNWQAALAARIEERVAEQATPSGDVKIGGGEAMPPILPVDALQVQDIPALEEVLLTPAQRQEYVDDVLSKFDAQFQSDDPNRADGIAQAEEALEMLRAQLPEMIDADRLRAQLQKELSAEQFQALEQNGGLDFALAALQQEIVALTASQALNPDLDVEAQKAIDDIRADMPAMVNEAVSDAMRGVNEGRQDMFNRAAERNEEAEALAAEAAKPENIRKEIDAAIEQAAGGQQPALEGAKP